LPKQAYGTAKYFAQFKPSFYGAGIGDASDPLTTPQLRMALAQTLGVGRASVHRALGDASLNGAY